MTAALLTRPTPHFPGAADVPDPAPLCIIGRRPHPATDGLICRPHLEELGTWLHDIEREAALLDARPPMSSRYDRAGGSSLASRRSPAVLDVIVSTDHRSAAHGHRHPGPACLHCRHQSCDVIRDDQEVQANGERILSIISVLHGWAQDVRDGRMLGIPVRPILVRVPPGHEGVYVVDANGVVGATTLVPAQATVLSERRLLSHHLDWIARQDWVDDFRRELGDLRNQLLRANRNEEDQPLSGHCYRLVDGVECGGRLWPAEPKHSTGYEDDAPDRQRAVVCDQHPEHRWERHELAMLSLILERQRREEMPPAAPGPPPPPAYPSGLAAGNGDRLTAVLDQQRREEAAS